MYKQTQQVRPASSILTAVGASFAPLPVEPASPKTEHEVQIQRVLHEMRSSSDMDRVTAKLNSGQDIAPYDLMCAVLFGTESERRQVRDLLIQPAAIARNQDLVLPHMRAVVAGDKNALNFWMKHRVVLPETIPEWARESWRSASWRTIDLFQSSVDYYIQRAFIDHDIDTAVQDEYRYLPFPPLNLSAALESDPRTAWLTAEIALGGASVVVKQFPYKIPPDKNAAQYYHEAMKSEVEGRKANFMSTTIVGHLWREALLNEAEAMVRAYLLDDALLALGLPLNAEARRQVWGQNVSHFDLILQHAVIVEGPKLVERMRVLGMPEDQVEERLSAACLSGSFKTLRREIMPKEPKQGAPRSTARVSSSEFTADVETEEGDVQAPRRSMRSLFQAAIESYGYKTEEAELNTEHGTAQIRKWSRSLEKLVSGRVDLLGVAMRAIEAKCDLAELIEVLRERRREGLALQSTSSSNSKENGKGELLPFEEESDRVEWDYVYSPEASNRMAEDGQLRHASQLALADYQDRPELARKRKINETNGIWELKVSRPEVRVYYRHEGPGVVRVVQVGYKRHQVRDTAELQRLYPRE